MLYSSQGRFRQQVEFVRQQFAQVEGLPFADVLSAELIESVVKQWVETCVERLYTPLVTLWMFLSQVLSSDQSCRLAVARLVAHRVAMGLKPCSSQTGGYCQARKRLAEGMVQTLVQETGRSMEAAVDPAWLWKGRSVKVFDGSTVSMPDTPENQAAYPQPPTQKRGVGFPMSRIAAVFSLASGAVLDWGNCRYAGKDQSELGLFRELWHLFAAGDVVLTDRYLCSWFEMAILQQNGVDMVARLHQARVADFRRGQRLGRNDHLVQWPKPPKKPHWLDQETYDALPEVLVIREIRVRVTTPGFRSKTLDVATTLTDDKQVRCDEIAGLYRARWHAELDLRSLKETMQMDVLRCKTPDMVRKEIATHLLAYNLIRTLMAQAAAKHGVAPRTISFKGAIQTLLAFQPHLAHASTRSQRQKMYDALLNAIINHQVANRPNRYEPRRKKRRPKPYRLLMTPRQEAKRQLVH